MSVADFVRRTLPISVRSASLARGSRWPPPISRAWAARWVQPRPPAAFSLGTLVAQVGPEASLTYEGGLHFRQRTVRSSLSVFVNEIRDNIAKQSLVLPAGAVGKTLGGTPITSQNANGAVFVAAATTPVLVRVNFDNARIVGVEHTLDWNPNRQLLAR